MKPIKFEEQNIVFAEDQPQYQPLPAFRNNDSEFGEVVSCWQLTLRERLKILFTGKIWLCLLSYKKPLTPSYMTVNKKDLNFNE